MKLALVLAVALSAALTAQTPKFITEGEVYRFAVAGQREPVIASVVKDEGAGWVKISTVQKSEEFWLNLAHEVMATSVKNAADALKTAIDRKQVITNLRTIAAAADNRLHESKEPTTDALFI